MRRPVLLAPAVVLSEAARPVTLVGPEVQAVCRDLLDTMRYTPHSVGVAAPQIGVGLRICCVDVTGHQKANTCHGELVLVNPEIVWRDGSETAREGCMSVPDLTGDVTRATELTVRALTADGEPFEVTADAFEARVLQHEIDHLDGLLFVDKVVSARHLHTRKVYR